MVLETEMGKGFEKMGSKNEKWEVKMRKENGKRETGYEKITSCVPWEKFNRAMFIPFSISWTHISTDLEAGPVCINKFRNEY